MEKTSLFVADKSRKPVLYLAFQTLGVIYGDIGTSPLYTYSGLCATPPSREKVLGITSLIVYTLIWLVFLKYCTFILLARNGNEGGILALYSLAVKSVDKVVAKRGLILLSVVGAAMILGDGCMTPAVSILSAVGGIAGFKSSLVDSIVPISIVITILLFLVQSYGTARISWIFSPVMFLWFVCLFVIGLINLGKYGGDIFIALNPGIGLRFLFSGGWDTFNLLGAVFLAATGLEAMYADVGHFSPMAVRLSWSTVAFPALLFNYLGQGAALLKNPGLYSSTFYMTVPGYAPNGSSGFYYFIFGLSTLATVIASQAMISGAFTLASHAISLGFLPNLTVKNTSMTSRGQIYVPVVNYILMVLTVLVMLGFGTNPNITHAYGLLVCTVMVITTVLFSVVVHLVWKKHIALLIAFLFFFLPVDMAFWVSSLAKIPDGGWVPMVLAIIISSVMIVWTYGSWQVETCRDNQQISFPKSELPSLVEDMKALDVTHSRGLTVFLSPRTDMVPKVFMQYISHARNLSERVCFVHIIISHTNVIPEQDQLKLTEHSPGFCTLDVTLGYTQSNPNLTALLNRAGLIPDGQNEISNSSGDQPQGNQGQGERGNLTVPNSPEHSVIRIEDRDEKDPEQQQEGGGHYQDAREGLHHKWRIRMRTVCVLSERIAVRPRPERKQAWERWMLESFRVLHSTTNNPTGTIIINPDELVEVGKVMII